MVRSRAFVVMVLVVAPLVGSTQPKSPAPLSPRVRAGWGQVLYLQHMAQAQVNVPALEQEGMTKAGCPTDIDTVTFGVAKTDPWDHEFLMRCTPGSHVPPLVGSAGPDGKPNTADDLWTDRPIVDRRRACTAACARARGCKAGKSTTEALCAATCATQLPEESAFYADSCTQLAACSAANDCFGSAVGGRAGSVGCDEFARAAAKAVHAPAAKVAALTKECERDELRASELPCIAASTTSAELVRCFLTVNRMNVADLLN